MFPRSAITLLLCLLTAAAVHAQSLEKNLALQIALEREGFSPGLIDGKPGAKTTMALHDFQKAHGLELTSKLDSATSAALDLDHVEAIGEYTVTSEDLDGVTGEIPKDWNERAKMPVQGYIDLADCLSEQFHTKIETLGLLNPGVSISSLHAGSKLDVPNVDAKDFPKIASLLIDLQEKTIRGFDESSKQVALLHCSIAKDKAKRPSGEAHVVVVALNPNYTFDPAMWSDVHNVTHKLTIAPGPRNPVGMAWVGLSLPGYGIHGTPVPAMIGKTGSHGCFRLTNWDAQRLAKAIRPGAAVEFR